MTTMSAFSSAAAALPWIVWAVALPLAAAIAAFVARRTSAWPWLLAAAGVTTTIAGLTGQVWLRGPQRYPLGAWGAPLGIELYADGLSLAMLLMTAVVGLAVSVHAVGYFPHRRDEHDTAAHPADFWALWLFLWAALNALFVSGDVFNLYVTLELITMSAVGLVTLTRTTAANEAALRYLLAALFGSLLYLLGIAVLYASVGVLDIASLGRVLRPAASTSAAVALMVVGLAIKAALFPLHFWLPAAHANAPAPVSAVLSALVVTAPFYVLLRLWFDAFAGVLSGGAAGVLAGLGAAAIAWGSVHALLAPGLKGLIAYSTVAQLGYLFLVFALTQPGERSGAWLGAVVFAVSHACAKASMFLAAGNVLHASGHDRIAELPGVGRRMPVTFFTMGIASVTLMGLPPSGAFIGKWMLLDAAISQGAFGLAAIIVGGGLLAAGYLFRVLRQAFTPSAAEGSLSVPRHRESSALLLALLAMLLGLMAAPLFDLLEIAR